MPQAMPARVALVGGLHGRAREDTADRLLRADPGAIAIHHDLSRISEGIVHRVTRDRWGEIERTRVELVHTCVSCTLREDLVPLLCSLAERGEHTLYVVEAWDGVEPRPIAQALTGTVVDGAPVTDWLRLASVITAVSADRLVADLATTDGMADRALAIAAEDDRTVAEVLAQQIEYPTALALHRGDRDHAVAEQCGAVLGQLNPAAVVLPAEQAPRHVHAGAEFDAAAAAVRTDPAAAQPPDHCARGDVRTVTWRRSRPMHPGRLHDALDDVVAVSLRSRGRFWLASHPETMLVWDAAGSSLAMRSAGPWLAALPDAVWDLVPEYRKAAAALDWAPTCGDRCQCISFTGVGLDTERLVRVLDSCLLTEEEFADESLTFDRCDDPFAELLDTPS